MTLVVPSLSFLARSTVCDVRRPAINLTAADRLPTSDSANELTIRNGRSFTNGQRTPLVGEPNGVPGVHGPSTPTGESDLRGAVRLTRAAWDGCVRA